MNSNTSTATQQVPEPNQVTTGAQSLMMSRSEELRRLESQGMFLRPGTRDFLERVGIAPGMRVLDIGCGVGDVSFVASELVGPTGEIIGLDRQEAALSTAAMRAQAKGLTNVRFVQCDLEHLETIAAQGPFDAVVGRLVIMNLPRPAGVIRNLLRLIRPGGVVGFQECDFDMPYWSTHKIPSLDKLHAVIHGLIDRGLVSSNLSSVFMKAFDEAGITQRRIIRTGAMESASSVGVYRWLGDWVRSFGAVAAKLGVPAPDFGPRPFDEAMREEVDSQGAVYVPFFWLGAAGRLPHLRPVEND